jgi:methionyl aminopeptidase
MIRLKTGEEIKILAEGGRVLSGILKEIVDAANPGVSTLKLEKMARRLIRKAGGEPAFFGYKTNRGEYPAALCVSVNDAVVHTPATAEYEIKKGDTVSLDLGLRYKNFYTDMAVTAIAGRDRVKFFAGGNCSAPEKKVEQLLKTARLALREAIGECRAGAPISAIGKKIQRIVEKNHFNVIRDLVGHGVGYSVHEEPMVPNYYDRAFDKIIMKEGLVIAIEPMITTGRGAIELAGDNFTYRTVDGAPAAHFEATIAITKKGPLILTPLL